MQKKKKKKFFSTTAASTISLVRRSDIFQQFFQNPVAKAFLAINIIRQRKSREKEPRDCEKYELGTMMGLVRGSEDIELDRKVLIKMHFSTFALATKL